MLQAGLLGVVAGLTGYVLLTPCSGAGAGARSRLARWLSGPAAVWARRLSGGGGTQDRRAVRQERRQAARHRGAQGRARVARRRARPRGFGRRGGPGGFGRGGMAPGTPGPKLTPADVKSYPDRAALRPRHAAHGLPPVRERRLGAGARGLQQHRRRSAGDRHRRRQDLQERRRALPRRVVVHDGARGVEALAEPVVRLRRREAGARRLPHAQPAERERRSDVRAHGPLLRDRAAVHPGAEGQLRARRDQRRELGRLRQRAAVQQGLHARLFQEHEGRALEGARAAPAAAAAWSTSATTRRAYKRHVRDQDEGRCRSRGRISSSSSRCSTRRQPTSSKPRSRRSSTSTAR